MAKTARKGGGRFQGMLRRVREQRLPQSAGGLTFTTLVSLVPLLAVSFALFARTPALRPVGEAIREHLLRGLLPADIARTVARYLEQFAGNAGAVTLLGFGALLLSSLLLLLSVENTLNRIWSVKKPRPVLHRLALYACILLTGPVVVGAGLWATSSLLSGAGVIVPILLAATGFACLFRFVPHTRVRWRDAIACGLLAGVAFEFGKRGFAVYLANVPAYRTIYGAFAPLLAFLAWMYYSWLVTLAAAFLCAGIASL